MFDIKFTRENVDTILFLKKKNDDLFIIQIYVDDFIFGAINAYVYQEFTRLMQEKFKMSMMGELNFLLELQIKQTKKRSLLTKLDT